MARPTVGDKPSDIREATVADVVACGIANASINRIAKRAQLSVGTIYRHFDSKDDLLRSVFLEIKTDLHRSIMAVANENSQSDKRIKAVWFAMLDYAQAHPSDFLYAEKIGNDLALNDSEQQALSNMAGELSGIVELAIADGTLREGSAQHHILILSAPAIQLARTAAEQDRAVDLAEANVIFTMLWCAVAKKQLMSDHS